MLNVLHHLDRTTRSSVVAMAVAVLACLTLFSAGGEAKADYSCVENITQVGNTVIMAVTATSGGPFTNCSAIKSIGTSNANISISGSILSNQIGATVAGDTVSIEAQVYPQGLPPFFEMFCQHANTGGNCNTSQSGFINGVDYVKCWVRGNNIALPDPALPLVPVVITSTCTINY